MIRQRARRITLLGVAILAVASAAFAVQRPLLMSAPACMAGRWHGCFDTFNGVVLTTVVALPLAALVVCALARRRRADRAPPARRVVARRMQGGRVDPSTAEGPEGIRRAR